MFKYTCVQIFCIFSVPVNIWKAFYHHYYYFVQFSSCRYKTQSLCNLRNNHLFIMCHFHNHIWYKLHYCFYVAVIQYYLFNMEILLLVLYVVFQLFKKMPYMWLIFYGVGNKRLISIINCDQICQNEHCSHTISMFTFHHQPMDKKSLTKSSCVYYSQNF